MTPGVDKSFIWKVLQGVSRLLTTLVFDLKTYDAHHIPRRGAIR